MNETDRQLQNGYRIRAEPQNGFQVHLEPGHLAENFSAYMYNVPTDKVLQIFACAKYALETTYTANRGRDSQLHNKIVVTFDFAENAANFALDVVQIRGI